MLSFDVQSCSCGSPISESRTAARVLIGGRVVCIRHCAPLPTPHTYIHTLPRIHLHIYTHTANTGFLWGNGGWEWKVGRRETTCTTNLFDPLSGPARGSGNKKARLVIRAVNSGTEWLNTRKATRSRRHTASPRAQPKGFLQESATPTTVVAGFLFIYFFNAATRHLSWSLPDLSPRVHVGDFWSQEPPGVCPPLTAGNGFLYVASSRRQVTRRPSSLNLEPCSENVHGVSHNSCFWCDVTSPVVHTCCKPVKRDNCNFFLFSLFLPPVF